ncbi:matrilin-2-like [Ruditapes philippinarum]|uniref:matrilin-2-like n=1 Tax=Ruditapes philippinarum TaxID=129788 RepID=UPI00295A715A|nr:matrilin-2-like [Ruditapes philippinarum]
MIDFTKSNNTLCFGKSSCPNGGTCSHVDLCSCPRGFSSPKCNDIDECSSGTHECQHNCVNTHGSYTCTCRAGFILSWDRKSCLEITALRAACHCDIANSTAFQVTAYLFVKDIDECSSNSHGCQHDCVNTYGSYRCTCSAGFTLNSDLKSCPDIEECKNSVHGCKHNCVNTHGSYRCTCRDGFYLSSDLKSCLDIDECSGSTHGCQHNCVNSQGSYRCTCRDGFILDPDLKSCLNVFAIIVGPVLGAVAIFVTVVLVIVCAFNRRKWWPNKVSSNGSGEGLELSNLNRNDLFVDFSKKTPCSTFLKIANDGRTFSNMPSGKNINSKSTYMGENYEPYLPNQC